jgi:hypothetical protein
MVTMLASLIPWARVDAQAPSPRWTGGVFWRSGLTQSGGIGVSRRAYGERQLQVYVDATAAKRTSTPALWYACLDTPCRLPDQRLMERRYSLGLSVELHRSRSQGLEFYGVGAAAVAETHWRSYDGGIARAAQLGLGGGLAFEALGGLNRIEVRGERILDAVRPIHTLRIGIGRSW